MKRYIFNLLIAIDQLFNSIFGGFPDETISSRMGKNIARKDKCPICIFLCKVLDIFEKDHCKKSIECDEGLPK